MDDLTFYIKVKESLTNEEEIVKLFTQQANETNNGLYWYLLFKYLNNYYIDFNPDNVRGLEYLELAIKKEEENGYRIFNKSYYKLDYEYMVFLSKIDNYMVNIVASATSSMFKYIDGSEYIDKVDLSKLKGLEFDPDYLVYASRLYDNDIRVNYKCASICFNLISEKYYEKIIIKSLIDMDVNYHKDIKKIKKLSDFDKVTLLKRYASYIFS